MAPPAKAKKAASTPASAAKGKAQGVASPAGVGKKQKDKQKDQKQQLVGDEIEDIFKSKPAAGAGDGKEVTKAAGKKGEAPSGGGGSAAKQAAAAQQQAAPKVVGSKDDLFGEQVGKARKKTEEGWNVYSEAELGLGAKGGDTDLCPFDCQCCF